MKVVIIGGGPSGLCAAISAGLNKADVTILEKDNRVGKKLLKTGNGRCNLSNHNISKDGYNHPAFVYPTLEKISCDKLLEKFKSFGLFTYSDNEGRVYPISDNSSSVLDILRLECSKIGAQEICNTEVVKIDIQQNGQYKIITKSNKTFFADKVIVATGGGTSLLETMGHKIVPFSPVLCPIKTNTEKIKGLSGLRIKCKVSLLRNGKLVVSEFGEIMFRDYGVSGIVIFNISRFAKKGDILSLDLLPEISLENLEKELKNRPFDGNNILTGIFHRRIGETLINTCKTSLAQNIKDFTLEVVNVSDRENAQVTRGGLDVAYINNNTFESTIYNGLYCVGECLDIDGKCGGYNLHWAFSSGLIAGEECSK